VRLRTAGDRSLAEEADHGLTSEEGACSVHFGVCGGCEVYGLTCRSRVFRVESEVGVMESCGKLEAVELGVPRLTIRALVMVEFGVC
jgi:hypothetical protein